MTEHEQSSTEGTLRSASYDSMSAAELQAIWEHPATQAARVAVHEAHVELRQSGFLTHPANVSML